MSGHRAQPPWAGSTRADDLPKDWRKRRGHVLERDPVCRLRLVCDGAPTTEVDHIGERTDHRLHMLRGVCHPCHRTRSLGQAAQARGAGPTRRRPAERHPGLL